mmetsp:Transcript_13232/g.31102  ORF Transcript_13232/g.31102 Transcript_13232/m.31102 type:complete len:415 (-) Transcript_13232:368-1612(-)
MMMMTKARQQLLLSLAASWLSASVCRAFAPSPLRSSLATMVATTTSGGTGKALAMFTGIVEEMGTVVSMEDRNDMILWDGSTGVGTELTVRSGDGVVMEGAYLGCSICVSGVCLTATVLDPAGSTFTVGLAPETLDKTYFRSLRPGTVVNLERASEIGGRNSGHFVQGHVDGTGTIVDKRVDGDSLRVTIEVDEEHLDNIMRYVVPKGFIAIDGTSLTVVDVDVEKRTFGFMLVEYTQKKIVIPRKVIGEKVNLEVDVLGKYSETAMSSLMPRLEALEAKVESLERSLAAATVESSPQQSTAVAPSTTYSSVQSGGDVPPAAAGGGYASDQKRMASISEGTPTFGNNIGNQGVLGNNDDPNSAMMRPEGGEEAATTTGDDGSNERIRRVAVAPDPKMDDVGGISGNKFVRIDGS